MLEKMGDLVEITTLEALAGLSREERERLQAQLLTIRANLADRSEAETPAAAEEAAGTQRMAAGAD